MTTTTRRRNFSQHVQQPPAGSRTFPQVMTQHPSRPTAQQAPASAPPPEEEGDHYDPLVHELAGKFLRFLDQARQQRTPPEREVLDFFDQFLVTAVDAAADAVEARLVERRAARQAQAVPPPSPALPPAEQAPRLPPLPQPQ